MAIAAVAGLATAGGAAAFGATVFGLAAATLPGFLAAFALGAGLSMVSRALMPKPSMPSQMAGIGITKKEPALPRNIIYGRAKVGGAIVFIHTTGEDNKYIHLVIALASHEVDGFEEVYFNNNLVWDGDYVGDWGDFARINLHDGSQTTADSDLVSASSYWTNNHILNGVAYMYVRLEYDAEQFANGLPNFSVVMRGKKVYDPQADTTAWSQNPALCVRDYLTSSAYGLAEPAANINYDALVYAKGVCNESVDLSGGGSENRYEINGVVDTSASRKENIEAMLTSMGGSLVYSGGQYFINAAGYRTPTVTIDETMLVGAIDVQTRQSRRSLYNAVKGVFLSEEENYILADYPPIISSTYGIEDGDPIYLDMPLAFTTSNTRAQRLAKIALLQSRQQTKINIPCNLVGLKFKAGDNIKVTNTKMGWDEKVFQVLDYSLSFGQSGEIVVNVSAIETAAAIYDWSTDDQQDFLTGGEIVLYDGFTVAPPTSFAGVAITNINDDGTTLPQIELSWTASNDAFVTHYEVQYSIDGSTWTSITTTETNYVIPALVNGETYYNRVRAVNELNVKSDFVTANVAATGDVTPPAAPSAISATAGYKSISLEWVNPPERDFSNVEVYRATSSGGTYSLVANVGGGFGANAEFLNGGLPSSTAFFYKFKAVDYSGNKSAFTSVVSATTNAEAIDGVDGADGADGAPGADGADGAAGTRNAAGYVYYALSSASSPSTPSATSYNFSTGSFGGLTGNWSRTPPTNTGGDAKYWATSYYVTEATFGGSQTIVFGSPFSSFTFDGLVTFTNLNDELANPSSTEITTINGGLIKTGTLDVGLVNIEGTSGSGINIKSAASGSRMEIESDVIRIYDGSTLRVKLGNLT